MKVHNNVVILIFALLINLNILYAQAWELKNSGLPADNWNGMCIDASDSNNAVISVLSSSLKENSGIYITSNGGENWEKSPFSFSANGDVIHLSAKNNLLIWAATSTGKIYFSSDRGINWSLQFEDTSLTRFINYIKMFDSNNGIAMGDPVDGKPAVFLKTTNSGITWNLIPNSTLNGIYSGDTWRRLDFLDIMNGYFFTSGVSPQKLYKTTDGGYTWTDMELSGYFEIIKYFNEDLVLASSASNPQGIFRITDSGNSKNLFSLQVTWGEDFECIPGDFSQIFFADNLKLYYSEDSGKTYTEVLFNNESIAGRDLVFTDPNHGWILGTGKVYKTNTGGKITSTREYEQMLPQKTELLQNYPNPFNPNTTIRFILDKHQYITLKIFDINGNEISSLFNGVLAAGYHDIDFRGDNIASGIYFYQLVTEEKCLTKKLMLLK